MPYETSYESGRKPFAPDLNRGYWASRRDFVYACLGLAFKFDVFFVSSFMFFEMGITAIIPYLIYLALYVVPLMIIQSFMGQFSSSGFISVFRISPLFKGMGYVSLGLNIGILLYYSLFAAVPLLYLLYSLQPTLPWSCEAADLWGENITVEEQMNLCNITDHAGSENGKANWSYRIPSMLFFKSHFQSSSLFTRNHDDIAISWALVGCNLIVWSIVAFVFHTFRRTRKLGTLLRYTVWITLLLLIVCLTRFMFLPGADRGIANYLQADGAKFGFMFVSVSIYAVSAFGAGWGTIITLSSFNKFRTNVICYSWIIGIGQMLIYVAFGLLSFIIQSHLQNISTNVYHAMDFHWILFLASGSVIANMELANMWSILFYGMLTSAGLVVIVTQLFSILTSLYDEFESLRAHKTEVTFGLIGISALCSLYFCTNCGGTYFAALSMDSLFTQVSLNLLLLLVILWTYGRERFQRDIEFMLGMRFPTWKIYMLRFVAPFCLLYTMVVALSAAFYEHIETSVEVLIAIIVFIVLPWIFVPGYALFVMSRNTGSLLTRFKKSCRPMDWYPVDADERKRYDHDMGNTDALHHLEEICEDTV